MNMNKTIKSIFLTALTLSIVFCLTGCEGGEENEPVNIAFVVGIADDETKLNEGISELSNLPASPGTDYAFISIEGEPRTIGEAGTIPDFSAQGYTNAMMDRVRAGIMADLTERLNSYKPKSSEIDMAASTELAVRTLNAHAVEGRKNILTYYCSGKSTTGLINMLETPVYQMDVQSSAAAVAEKMNLDMSNIDEVIWYCLGDFGNKQAKLYPDEKAQLREFYTELFTSLGAKKITFKDNLPNSESYSFPDTPVSCMPVEGTESGLVDLDPEMFKDADSKALESPIVIPETQVSYKGDSAEFLDADAAKNAIQPVADFLLESPEVSVLIYGTCAGDVDSSETLTLGKARAESVKQVLVSAGVDEKRITAVTVKVTDDPYHQFNLGTGSEATVNRKTVMIDMSTEFAKQILANAI